jgi:hypothetical protein
VRSRQQGTVPSLSDVRSTVQVIGLPIRITLPMEGPRAASARRSARERWSAGMVRAEQTLMLGVAMASEDRELVFRTTNFGVRLSGLDPMIVPSRSSDHSTVR